MDRFKKIVLTGLVAALVCAAAGLAACSKQPGRFLPEYSIRSGECVTVEGGGATYRLAVAYPGVTIDGMTGRIDFEGVEPYTQIIVLALQKDKVIGETKVTLLTEFEAGAVSFVNPADNIVNGEHIRAVSQTGGAVTYALKAPVDGVSVDRTTGRVTFAASVEDGAPFTVTATSRGTIAEKTFKASTRDFVTVECDRQIVSLASPNNVGFKLDFGTSGAAAQGVLGVQNGSAFLDESAYTYDDATKMLKLDKSVFADFPAGEKQLSIITAKNSVTVTIVAATAFISTAEQLAAVNDSPEALSGYYILTRDIDLTEYCSRTDEGWTPIGTYHDVADGTALVDAFKGTIDGNGHTVTGFRIRRDTPSDTLAYNAGLFGYVDTTAVIKNLGLIGGPIVTRSFSGAFVGVNTGTVENCFARVDIECVGNYVGGFVGRNEGIIRNCYSYGKVVGEQFKGTFAGRNLGLIDNAFAVKLGSVSALVGVEEGSTTGRSFTDAEQFAAYPFDELPAPWVTGGAYPALGEAVKAYYMLGVFLSGLPDNLYKGESAPVTAVVSPADALDLETPVFSVSVGSIEDGVLTVPKVTDADTCVVTVTCGDYTDTFAVALKDPEIRIVNDEPGIVKGDDFAVRVEVRPNLPEYLAAVRYTIDNGLTVSASGVVTTGRNTAASSCTVTASIEGVGEARQTFTIFDRVTGVAFTDDTDDTVYAGHSYRMFAQVLPATALQTVTYRVAGLAGVTVAGDVLHVADTADSGTVTLTVTAGSFSAQKTVKVIGKTPFDGNTLVLEPGEDAVFTLPVPAKGLVVKRMEKVIEAVIDGSTVTVPAKYLEGFGDRAIEITFWLNDTVYAASVTVRQV